MTAPDDMLKLAACPFCGKDDIDRNSDKWGHWFYCSGCEAQDARGHSPAEATMNWNTRASAQRPTGGEVVATSLSIDDLLILLAEECSEVIKAATKCLRFGFDIDHGVDYGNNRMVLSREVGDLLAIIEALPLDRVNVEVTRSGKIAKAEKAKQQYGRTAAPSETGHGQSEMRPFCSCKASQRDGRHMAWCPAIGGSQSEVLTDEPTAWMVERVGDRSFPRVCWTKEVADALVQYVNVAPPATIAQLYRAPAQASAVRGAWTPAQFWEYVEGLTDPLVREQMHDVMTEQGLVLSSAPAQASLMQTVETEALRYAEMYPQSSDGRNTFVIFADWVAGLSHPLCNAATAANMEREDGRQGNSAGMHSDRGRQHREGEQTLRLHDREDKADEEVTDQPRASREEGGASTLPSAEGK